MAVNRFDRFLAKAKEVRPNTYLTQTVAPIFQRMIRAEAAAGQQRFVIAICRGEPRQISRDVGRIVCVTCGLTDWWMGGMIETGHFISRRRLGTIIDERNAAPQCKRCNGDTGDKGAGDRFRMWLVAACGPRRPEQLEQAATDRRKWDHEQLVELRIQFSDRLKAAELSIAKATT